MAEGFHSQTAIKMDEEIKTAVKEIVNSKCQSISEAISKMDEKLDRKFSEMLEAIRSLHSGGVRTSESNDRSPPSHSQGLQPPPPVTDLAIHDARMAKRPMVDGVSDVVLDEQVAFQEIQSEVTYKPIQPNFSLSLSSCKAYYTDIEKSDSELGYQTTISSDISCTPSVCQNARQNMIFFYLRAKPPKIYAIEFDASVGLWCLEKLPWPPDATKFFLMFQNFINMGQDESMRKLKVHKISNDSRYGYYIFMFLDFKWDDFGYLYEGCGIGVCECGNEYGQCNADIMKLEVNKDGGADGHLEACHMSDTFVTLLMEEWFETAMVTFGDPKISKIKKDVIPPDMQTSFLKKTLSSKEGLLTFELCLGVCDFFIAFIWLKGVGGVSNLVEVNVLMMFVDSSKIFKEASLLLSEMIALGVVWHTNMYSLLSICRKADKFMKAECAFFGKVSNSFTRLSTYHVMGDFFQQLGIDMAMDESIQEFHVQKNPNSCPYCYIKKFDGFKWKDLGCLYYDCVFGMYDSGLSGIVLGCYEYKFTGVDTYYFEVAEVQRRLAQKKRCILMSFRHSHLYTDAKLLIEFWQIGALTHYDDGNLHKKRRNETLQFLNAALAELRDSFIGVSDNMKKDQQKSMHMLLIMDHMRDSTSPLKKKSKCVDIDFFYNGTILISVGNKTDFSITKVKRAEFEKDEKVNYYEVFDPAIIIAISLHCWVHTKPTNT